VSGWSQAGLEHEEGGDQMRVAADDAELAAEFLPRVAPLPPPVREAAVETVPNHEDMNCSEHQIRLWVIAKFVQRLELGSAIQARRACGARAAGFAPLSLTPEFVGRPDTHNKQKKATDVLAFCVPSSVTETVSISRVAN
jgi:hypothetical protein